MKLNNKGYAITIIIFGILVVFIIVLSSLLVTMNNSVKLNKTVKEDVIENIQLEADTTGMSLTERIEQLEISYNELLKTSTENYNTLTNQITTTKQETINEIYPVGSVYISTTDSTIEQVQKRFGGTWEVYAQGRTLVGIGTTTDSNGNALVYDSIVEGGSTTALLGASNLPSHKHSIPALSGTAASTGSGYTLTYNTTGTNNASTGNQSANHTHSIPALSGSTNNTGAHTHNMVDEYRVNQANTPGSGYGFNVYYAGQKIATSSAGAHSHTVTTNASTTGSNSANHTHKYTNRYVTGVSGVASHSHSVTTTASNTGSAGSGTAFSVQDPYITVYMYKRIK